MLDPAREYFHWPEGHVYVTDRGNQGETLPVATRVRQCQGLLAVWATEDVEEGAADMIGLVPCSHQSNVPPPRGNPHDHCWHLGCILPRAPAMIVRAGVMEGRLVREMQLVRRPAMKQGDLLLASAAILHGGIGPPSGRLLSCSFISLTAPPSVGSLATPALSRGTTVDTPREPPRYRWHLGCILLKTPAISFLTGPDFLDELSPTARAIIDPHVFRNSGKPPNESFQSICRGFGLCIQ